MRRAAPAPAAVRALALAVAASAALAGGCAAPAARTPEPAGAAGDAPAAPAAPARLRLGRSVEGRTMEAVALGRGPAVLLVLATMHGDEAAGTPVAERLAARLEAEPWRLDGRRVVVVADANPDGRVAGTRTNAGGVDLNRDFPARNRPAGLPPAPTQPEAAAIAGLVALVAPDLVVSIHQPLACVDWDGPAPAAAVAARMARVSGLPPRRLGARPGSLGAWAGETLGIPVITLELPRDAGGPEAAARWDDAMLVAVHATAEAAAARRRDGALAPAQPVPGDASAAAGGTD